MDHKQKHAATLASKDCQMLSIAIYVSQENELRQLTEMLKSATGVDLSKEDALDRCSDELVVKLKKFEKEYSNILLGIILSTELEDPFHLRKPDTSSANKQLTTNYNFTYWLGAILIIFSLMYIFLITWIPIPEQNLRFADTILGVVIVAALQTVINFFLNNNTTFSNLKSMKLSSPKKATKKNPPTK